MKSIFGIVALTLILAGFATVSLSGGSADEPAPETHTDLPAYAVPTTGCKVNNDCVWSASAKQACEAKNFFACPASCVSGTCSFVCGTACPAY